MAGPGQIESKWNLDLSAYYKSLEDGLRRTKGTVGEINKLLAGTNSPAPAPAPAPTAPTSTGGRGGDTELKAQREAVRQLTTEYRDYRIALREGAAGEVEFLRNSSSLIDRLKQERSQLDETSRGYTIYTNALNTVTSGVAQVEGAQKRAAASAERQADVQEKAANRAAAAQKRADESYRLDRVRQYRDELSRLNAEYEKTRNRKQYIADVERLQQEMGEFRSTLQPLTREIGALDRVLGQSTRNLNTVQGKISGLGLSQQVAIGLNNQFANSLASTGGIAGGAASLGIAAYGGSLATISAGAAITGAAILGVGVGTAALVNRGIPQVKSFEKSINILANAGATDLDKLDQKLIDLQESAGRAGRQFSRSELAAALAETTKAGVSADDAFTILRSSIQLAAAEGSSLTDSTALVLKAIRQYQLDVGEAATVTDRLAQAGLLASGTTTDISTGLSRVAGTGRAAGVEMSDLIGMIVELDNAGLEASDRGSNALNSALSAIAGVTPKAREQLEAWNIALENGDGSARLAGDILADLGDKLRASGVQYDESTGQLTGNGDALRGLANVMGTEGARAVLNLTGKWRDYSKEIENSKNVSVEVANQMTQGLEPAQVALQKALDDLGKSAATIFAPGMTQAADALSKFARQVERINGLSFQNILDEVIGANGAERLRTVNRDLAETKRQLAEVEAALKNPANTTVTTERTGILGIGGLDQGEVDRFISDNEAQLEDLQQRLNTLQARRDNILEQYGLGKPSANRPGGQQSLEPLPLLEVPAPENAVDPAVQAQYEQAIRDSQDSATQAAIDSLEDGSAKINATYHERIELEKRAFAQLTAGLNTSSSEYQQLQAASNIRIQALITQGNRELSDLTEQRLETQRNLNERIADAQAQLAQEQSGNDPIRQLANTFQQTTRQIAKDSAQLMSEAKEAYDGGAITFQQYQAKLVEIANLGTAQRLQAERDLTTGTNAELERRRQFIEDSQDRVADLQAEGQAAALRDRGNERGALKVELDGQLKDIQQNLDRQLEAEGLTKAQITALEKEATAERVKARQGYSRQLEVLNKQDEQAVRESQARIADLQADNQAARLRDNGNERGALRVELEADLRDVKETLAEQLSAEGLTQQQINLIHQEAQAKRAGFRQAYSTKIKELNKQDAEDAKAVLGEQTQAFRDAQISGMADIPAAQAQFGEDRRERRKGYEEALEDFDDYGTKLKQRHAQELADFKGTKKERQALEAQQTAQLAEFGKQRSSLIAKQNQTEALLARQHQQEINKTARDALKDYLAALKTHDAQLAALQDDARKREEANLTALLDIRAADAEQQLASLERQLQQGNGPAEVEKQAAAFRKLLEVSREQVNFAKQAVDAARRRAAADTDAARAARDRGDSTAEIIALEKQAADTQGRVVTVIEAQVDALKKLRAEQLEIVKSGTDVVSYLEAAGDLTGRDANTFGQTDRLLEDQQDNLVKVLEAQIRANAPVSERLATLQQINELEKEIAARGGKGIEGSQRRLIDEDALATEEQFERDAATALSNVTKIDQQLNTLQATLSGARKEFSDLLEAAGSGLGLSLTVNVDTTELEESLKAARQTLLDTFGPNIGNQIIQSATDMGARAGKGLVDAFALGLRKDKRGLFSEVESILQEIRDYLPSSDSKRGPLSDLTYSGGKLATTFAGGFRGKFGVARAAGSEFASIMRPAFAVPSIPTSKPLGYAPAAGVGGMSFGDTHIHVEGNPARASSFSEIDAQRLLQTVGRESGLISARRNGGKWRP